MPGTPASGVNQAGLSAEPDALISGYYTRASEGAGEKQNTQDDIFSGANYTSADPSKLQPSICGLEVCSSISARKYV